MPYQKLQLQVPGKLMIAGEYAVLEPYQKAMVIAVDRYITAEIESSSESYLSLPGFSLSKVSWIYKENKIRFHRGDPRLKFVRIAMETVFQYLREQSFHIKSFHLTITSDLDDPSGRKYGLGSSAAVVVSVVSSILHFVLEEEPTPNLIFRLAAMAHLKAQGSGSGADVAASTYGGWLIYSSFQPEWLLKRMKEEGSVNKLVEENWPYLTIKPLHAPEELKLCVGWTGKPVKTGPLIQSIQALRKKHPASYKKFLTDSANAVEMLVEGFKKGNSTQAINGINQNRATLARLGDEAKASIETDDLAKLAKIAEEFDGAGKPSGAGGGDCGIAFIPGDVNAEKVKQAWNVNQIIPLDLHVSPSGAKVI